MILSALSALALGQLGALNSSLSPLLMRSPTINATTIVFEFAGDLWSVPRSGGKAARLTSNPGSESSPRFSPDGKWIAFTGEYDHNLDAFVMPAEGGVPKRLTAHPGYDTAIGWTPDSKSVMICSAMASSTPSPRMFTVPITGGVPKALPFPEGTQGSLSPDGQQIAYVAGFKWQDAWKRYRGGQADSIWVAKLSDSSWKPIPKKNENNFNPMWVGNKVYYISDKNGINGLFSYDVGSGKVDELIKGSGFDLKAASAGPGAIVYEKLGSIGLYDLSTKKAVNVPIEIAGDFPEVRSEIKPLENYVSGAWPSPSGQRVAVIARGMLFSVPASKGQTRMLTEGEGFDRRDPAWSPDGKSIAYITDEHGGQEMAILDVASNKTKFMTLGAPPAFYERIAWSPDSAKISYTDRRQKVWILDVKSGSNTDVDMGVYTDPYTIIDPKWSPDSEWLTWSRDLDSHINAVFVYNLAAKKVTQLTDGMANAKNPVFDRSGKYLYFTASTKTGQAVSWLDLTSFNQPNIVSSVYAIVLKADAPHPLQPESDEEAAPAASETAPKPAEAAKPEKKNLIDLDGIEQRIIPLPMPEAVYDAIEAGPNNSVFVLQGATKALATDFTFGGTLWKFDFGSRTAMPFSQFVTGMTASADGSKILIRRGGQSIMASTAAPVAPSAEPVSLNDVRARIDPQIEWKRMFHMVWRNEKLLMYDPNLHGIDADAMDKRYSPFLDGIVTREQLNYLFTDMLGELSIGHMFIGGGDAPYVDYIPGGLLGADYTFENGRYRLARVYSGERWNPSLRAPLAQPGIAAKVGEYILAIDGKDLTELNDIYATLEGKAGKQVKVRIGPNPDGSKSREVTVVPTGSEGGLRFRAWSEDNRKRVAEATGGKVGYVHVPDTANDGWNEFNRYYYAQSDKLGMVVDERFNGGGLINNFMVDEMCRTLDGLFTPRHGKDWPTPGVAVFGPKVMLANQFAGSGGDMFPWLFKERKIGPVIGKRTWGGLVAAFGFALPDGGSVRAPNCAFYNPNGTWDVEGWGVSPDIEVELDPFLWRQGKDAQLERAIVEIQKLMKTFKYPKPIKPAYPDRTKVDVRH